MDGARPGHVLGVLDWELSTLGDPLADLAYLCMPYHMPQARAPHITLHFITSLSASLPNASSSN